MNIGQQLRAAREAREMSIGDIARRTFIQPKFIQAIDNNNLGIIPDSHRRLFIREYAKVVGADYEKLYTLLEDYTPPPPRAEPEYTADTMTASSARVRTIEQFPDAERKSYGEVLRRLSNGRGIKLSGSSTISWLIRGALILLLLAGGYYLWTKLAGKEISAAADPTVTDSSDDADQAQVLPRKPGDTGTSTTEVASDDSLTLEGHANSKVWFTVVSDGGKSDQGTLDSGMTKTWRAAELFKISLGNAGGLDLMLNGKSIGTLGPRGTSIRPQTIDANGVRSSLPGGRRVPAAPVRKPRAAAPASNQRTNANRRPAITPTEPRGTDPPRTPANP